MENLGSAATRGCQQPRHLSVLGLRVAASVVKQRRTGLGAHRFDFTDYDGVIATVKELVPAALDYAEHVIEDSVAPSGACEPNAFESVDVNDGKTSPQLLLARREYVDDESWRFRERIMSRRRFLDRNENECGLKAYGAEGTHGHSLIAARGVGCR